MIALNRSALVGPRPLLRGLTALCAAALIWTAPASASENLNQPVFSANATAGLPMTVQVSGNSDEPATLQASYTAGATCFGGAAPFATHAGLIGNFSFTETIVPMEPGPHCLHLLLRGPQGSSSQDTSFDVAPGTTAPRPTRGGPAGQPAADKGTARRPPLVLKALFHTAGTNFEVALHLRTRADVAVDLLLGAYTAQRLHIRGPGDALTHGRLIRVGRTRLHGAAPGWRRAIIALTRSAAAGLAGAGPIRLTARAQLSAAGGLAQLLTLRRTFTV